MKRAVVIRHLAFEDLGAFTAPLRDADYSVHYQDAGVCTPDAGPEPWDSAKIDLLIVLGGPIGAYEEHLYPWLTDEIDGIASRLRKRLPTMGICLGAQLIARALGAKVYPSGIKEIGIGNITLTDAGLASCLAPFADAPATLHWHGDTFDLPEGASLLASTDLCRNQAFSVGPNIIGFQFHPEADGTTFERWLIGHACELSVAGIDIRELRATMAVVSRELTDKAKTLLECWLRGLHEQ
ncbi:glutamine amidotransferase [Sphingobium phenoxybenzoativorans]|jgi:GMP synthase (glutamine-hydrolysing)|uniref:Glutamine amidotransferase n=1 Tax=Sphingobium phenoxybenzoativorans TaxID=1592790 RepID=A0A975KA59_9SPHN|nr:MULTISPECIES: glutamine amidotransferase [Sphingobium]QUT07620.1 glutamine amidotransferase [Sphingobium phenoxybenzoativorans]